MGKLVQLTLREREKKKKARQTKTHIEFVRSAENYAKIPFKYDKKLSETYGEREREGEGVCVLSEEQKRAFL